MESVEVYFIFQLLYSTHFKDEEEQRALEMIIKRFSVKYKLTKEDSSDDEGDSGSDEEA